MSMSRWEPTKSGRFLRRFGKLCEELGELVAVVGRAIIQGLDEVDPSSGKTNRQRLIDEIADVIAQCELIAEQYHLPEDELRQRVFKKKCQMYEWDNLFAGEPDE